jgi:hypothetical protein
VSTLADTSLPRRISPVVRCNENDSLSSRCLRARMCVPESRQCGTAVETARGLLCRSAGDIAAHTIEAAFGPVSPGGRSRMAELLDHDLGASEKSALARPFAPVTGKRAGESSPKISLILRRPGTRWCCLAGSWTKTRWGQMRQSTRRHFGCGRQSRRTTFTSIARVTPARRGGAQVSALAP